MPINDFHRGDTRIYQFNFDDGATPTPAAKDITGWEIYFTAKANKDDDDSLAVIAVKATAGDNQNPEVNDDPVNGLMYIAIPSDISGDPKVLVGSYFYDFQRVIPGAPPRVRTLDNDKVKILQDITIRDA